MQDFVSLIQITLEFRNMYRGDFKENVMLFLTDPIFDQKKNLFVLAYERPPWPQVS